MASPFPKHPREDAGTFLGRSWRWFFPKPRVFISYAREDAEIAEWLFAELKKSGFAVYLDTDGTLVGEQFLPVIIDHLRRSDAVLALISADSSSSDWCQAELYYAHALQRTIVPIRIEEGKKINLPAPLDVLQRETQYVPLHKEDDRGLILRKMQERFIVVRCRAHWRWVRRCGTVAAISVFLGWSLHSGVQSVLHERDRQELVSRLERAQTVLRDDVLALQIVRFKDDAPLRSRLLLLADDRERPVHTRLNARIFAAAIGRRPGRWYLESLEWANSRFASGELTETTFRTGRVSSVEFTDVTFSGVVWNEGPAFGVSGASFKQCRFHAGQFARTRLIDCDFINCLFYGTMLDVTDFGAVRFTSQDTDPESEVITSGQVCAFEHAIIANCAAPPAPGVLDFGAPRNEVMFTGVVFEECHFRGFIRPEWFRNCSFNRCVFPTAFRLEELTEGKNIETDSTHVVEPCP